MNDNKEGAKMFVATHVDDAPSTGNQRGFELLIERLKSVFEITIVKDPKMILGVQLERDYENKKLKLHQGAYIQRALEEFKLSGSTCKDIPMDPGVAPSVLKKIIALKADGKVIEQGREAELRSKIGKLIFLKTRPDVAFATAFMARFTCSAGDDEIRNVNNIFRYLMKDPSRGIILDGNKGFDLSMFCDADLGGDPESGKSTSGIVISIGGGGAMTYRSKLQRKVCDSTGMAETYAAHEGCRELQFYIDAFKDLRMDLPRPVLIKVDNDSVFKLNGGCINHAGSKHYRLAQGFIVDMIKSGDVQMKWVDTKVNRADLLTKALGRVLHAVHSKACLGE
jgi:hypothetical protein